MKFSIKVPATTANIGPGFDTAGIALSLYNTFTFEIKEMGGITFHDSKYDFKESLTLNTMFEVLQRYGIKLPNHLHLETESLIPVARGLGSSSTCIVAGVMAANQFASLNLTKHEITTIATEIEGHPDNVTAAIMGNMCLCVWDQNDLLVQNILVHPSLNFIAFYPNTPVSTKDARSILPTMLPYQDIVYSLSRASFLSYGFQSGDPKILETIISDRIHEPYRKKLINDYSLIKETLSDHGCIASWISGSGPTMVALVHDIHSVIATLVETLPNTYSVHQLDVDHDGATLVK